MNKSEFYVLGFYGYSGSGKTNLIVDLIKQLRKLNIEVATIKISDKDIGIDQEGKDTWKHGLAGSSFTVFSSPLETDFMLKKKLSISDIINYLVKFQKIEVILIEGVSDPRIPKIRVGKAKKRKNTLFTYDGDTKKIVTLILDNIKNFKDLHFVAYK
jgi:molybdopterin-guanine dinucleotide biosynthesis protein B